MTMADQPQDDTFSIQIANQIINIANDRMQEGAPADGLAKGLRHAAANFSAFAETRRDGGADPGRAVEEFIQLLEYYLGRHVPGDGAGAGNGETPAAGLESLIRQVKDEF